MAVEIPVVIDIDKAFQEAANRVNTAIKPMQKAIDEKSLEVIVEINKKGDLAEVLDFVGKTKLSMDNLKYAIKSVNQQLEQMKAKEGNLDFSQGEAKALLEARIILQDVLEQRKDLSKEISNSIRLTEQEKEAELARQAILNSNVNTMSALNAKLGLLTEDFENVTIGSGKWEDLAGKIQAVSTRMSEVNAWAKEIGSGSGSIDQFTARLQKLNIEWNSMASAKKFNGNELSSEAQEIYDKYKKTTGELKTQGQSLEQLLQKEQRRTQLIEQGRKRRQYESAVMSSTTKTLALLQEKEKILSDRLSRAEFGSNKYTKLKQDLQSVRKEIEEINKDIAGESANIDVLLGKADSKMANLVKNSIRLVALHSATSFIRNVREVTSEFEMQRVALGGIIQDTVRAEALFKQIKAAAIKSPFEIKELVTFTKQLSAYRIETDKLFDVTMQLADVSAGLGVDMGRLVLAYGQVRAASVLRGQELRQFTEAGIPLVELLADKFTELNNRTVTTAEVFDLISKRAVSFSMIEDIFNDMTSSGGMFYKMQEKQSETLLGQWMKLKDALSIMYDEIGNTSVVHGAMEKLMADAMNLMQNWRQIAGVLKAVGANFLIMKAASLFIPTLTRNTLLAKKAEDAFARSLAAAEMAARTGSASFQRTSGRLLKVSALLEKASLATNGFMQVWYMLRASMAGGGWVGLAITAVTALTGYLIAAQKEANRLGKSLAENVSKGNLQIQQAERNFKRLADAAVEAADGSSEQREALKELQRTYGDVIPSQDLQIEKLKELKGNYEALTDAIKEKIEMQIHEQNVNEITETYGTSLGTQRKGLEKFLKKEEGYSIEEATRIIEGVNDAIKEGLLTAEKDFFDAAEIIEQIIEESTGNKAPSGIGQRFQQASSLFGTRSYYKQLLKDTQKFNYELEEEDKKFAELSNTMGIYAAKLKEIREDLKKAPEGFTLDQAGTFEFNEAKWKQAVERYKTELTAALGDSISDAFSSPDFIDFGIINDKLSLLEGSTSGKLKSFVSAIQKDYLNIAPQDKTTRLIREAAQRFANEAGASMDGLQGYLKQDETSMADYAKSVEGFVKEQRQRVDELEFLRKNYAKGVSTYVQPTVEEISAERDTLRFLEKLLAYVDDFLDTGKSSNKKSALSFLKEELKNVQEIYKRYKEFVEYMGEAGAEKAIKKIYGNVTAIDFLSPELYKKRIGDLLTQIKGLGSKVKTYNRELSDDMFTDIKETIKKNEGLRLEAYKLPGEKYYTIGYGFYKNLPDGREITAGMKLTMEEAEKLLDQYVKTYSNTASRLLADYGQGMQLTDKQFNVLVDLAYQGPNALKQALIKANGDINALGESLKDAASKLVAPQMRDAVKKRDMKRYAAFMAGMGTEEDVKDLSETIFNTERLVQDVDWDELKDSLDKSLKRITEEIKRSETARNFFNNILELTGDQELASTMSISVYGGIGEEFKERLQQQLNEALASLKAEDISDELRTAFENRDFNTILSNIDKFPEKWQEVLKQMASDDEKYNAELIKNFANLISKYGNTEQKIETIKAKANQDINKVKEALSKALEDTALTDEQRKALESRTAEIIKAIEGSRDLDVFKASDDYVKFFAEINIMTAEQAAKVRGELRSAYIKAFQDGAISADELKRNLRAVDEQFRKLSESSTLFGSYLSGGIDGANKKLQEYADNITILAAKMKSGKGLDEGEQEYATRMLKVFGSGELKGINSYKDLIEAFSKNGKGITAAGEAFGQMGEGMSAMASNAGTTLAIIDAIIKAVNSSITGVQQLIDQINEVRSEDNKIGGWFNYLSDFNKYAYSGWEKLKSGDVVGATVDTISSFISVFNNIKRTKIERLDRQIEDQADLLEDLEYEYSRLGVAMEEAFGNDYVYNYNKQLEVLQAKVEAYNKQAELEASKGKKSDEKKVEEYRNQARDAADEITELSKQVSEFFAGSDLASAAESFADSWLSAYQEFGDTSTAIEERMTEMVQNMMKKAALSGIAENILGNWYSSLADVTDWNAQTIAEKWKEAMALVEPMVQGMQVFANSMQAEGISLRNTAGQFTGISRDIAGASEESINGLAAGINTQNFYMSFMPLLHENVAQILTIMSGGNTVIPSGETGADGMPSAQKMLFDHLPYIDANINSILQLLKSVVSPKSAATATHYVSVK